MPINVKSLAECGVVILGGTGGVGLEAAGQFAEQGARLVLLGRDPKRGDAACAACRDRAPGVEVSFVAADARDPQAAVRAEASARATLGTIDVLVNASGISRPAQLLHVLPIEELSSRLDELALPPLHMTQAVLPGMRAQGGGSIVTVASDAAKVATPGESIIGAAMAAILMFSRTAALEAKREGVRVNVLTPSLIAETPGAEVMAADPYGAKLIEKLTARAHLGVPVPADIASVIVFLASPAARRITGQAISVNGGVSAA